MKNLLNRIEDLLKSDATIEIENSIAERKKCKIYKDDLPLLLNFLKDEVEQSELSIEELTHFIDNNKDDIVEFAICFLNGNSPATLSTGVAISYSIYLIYLRNKDAKQLELYIKKRRIPNSGKFLVHLKGCLKSNLK